MSERLLKKLKCKCGDYFISKYSNEYLQEKYPYIEGDKGFKSKTNLKVWMRLKRFVKCPNCGKEKKISKRLLMRISIDRYDSKKEK